MLEIIPNCVLKFIVFLSQQENPINNQPQKENTTDKHFK